MSLIKLLKSKPLATFKTLIILAAGLSLGLQASILGPALLDLKTLTSSNDISSVTWILTGRGIGFASGSAIAGVLEPFVNLMLLMAIGLIGSGILYMAIPLVEILWVNIMCGSLAGVSQGIIDTALYVTLIRIWSSDCPPFLQAVTSSYGIGSLIGPMIVRPFLLPEDDINTTITDNNITIDKKNTSVNCDTIIDGHCPSEVNLLRPFTVVSAFPILVAIFSIIIYVLCRNSDREKDINRTFNRSISKLSVHSALSNISNKNQNEIGISETQSSISKTIVITLSTLFAFFYMGILQGYASFIPAYGVGYVGMDKLSAAAISSLFWTSMTIFQLVSIPVTSCIGLQWTLWFNIANSIVASLLLLFGSHNKTIFIISSSYLGLSYASTWGALFAFLETKLTVTGIIISIVTAASCIGQSVSVAAIGIFVDSDPISLPISVIVSNLSMLILYAAICFICKIFFSEKRILNQYH